VICGSIRDDAAMLADTADDEYVGDTDDDDGSDGGGEGANAISSNITFDSIAVGLSIRVVAEVAILSRYNGPHDAIE
jgi:hypothetical protein